MIRVFFVDDEAPIRMGLGRLIPWEEYGIEVVGEASNGQEALEKLTESKAEIVITDIKMPVMNGLEFIREIKKIYRNVKIIIISGYDEFEYVKEALKYGVENYIIKPISQEELSNTVINCVEKIESEKKLAIKLRKDEEVIRNNLIFRLLKNGLDKYELEEKMKYIYIDKYAKQFQVAIVKILLDENINEDFSIFRFGVMNICDEILRSSLKCSLISDYEENVIITFFGEDLKSKKERIERLIQKCSTSISKYLKINTFIAIGNIQYSFFDIYLSYNSTLKLMDYSFVSPPNSLKIFDQVEKENYQMKLFHNLNLKELTTMIHEGNCEYVILFYEKILKSLPNTNPENLYNIVVQILINIIELLKVEQLELDEIAGEHENLYVYLFKDNSIDIMLDRTKSISIKTTKKFLEIKNRPKTLIQNIVEYIDEHYNEDISLKVISHQFNINGAYLGQLIKKECGLMFTDYINNIRISIAKELLKKTELNSSEISIKVGYANSNYFYRVFKKYTGIYPTDYRNQFNKSNQ